MRLTLALLWLLVAGPAWAGPSTVGGRTSPDGAEELQIDLPGSQHMRNTGGMGRGGPGTGAGLCVFTSGEMSARWANEPKLVGLQKYMTTQPGGGYPSKVDAVFAKFAPGVRYVQHTGGDVEFLRLVLRTGRLPCVTYGYSPRYGGSVAHMVNLVHLSEKWACVLDNNFPGEASYEWMSPEEFLKRWRMNGGGWAYCLLAPPPPPIPSHAHRKEDVMTPFLLASTLLLPAGSWGAGPCVAVATPRTTIADAYEWVPSPTGSGQLHLFRGRNQLGTWADGAYYPLAGDRHQPAADLPTGAPPLPVGVCVFRAKRPESCKCCTDCECTKDGKDLCPCPQTGKLCNDGCRCIVTVEDRDPRFYFGVEKDVIPQERRTWTASGDVDPDRLRHLLAGGGTLADDSQLLRLTVIGDEADCRHVESDMVTTAALAPYRDKVLVQCYRPTDWAVTGVGLPADGRPTILVQAPPDAKGRGKLLHLQRDYADGAAGLALAFAQLEGLRRPNPDLDPLKVPDQRKPILPRKPDEPKDDGPSPNPKDWPVMAQVAAGVGGGGAGLAILLLLGRLAWAWWSSRKAATLPNPTPTPAAADPEILRRVQEILSKGRAK